MTMAMMRSSSSSLTQSRRWRFVRNFYCNSNSSFLLSPSPTKNVNTLSCRSIATTITAKRTPSKAVAILTNKQQVLPVCKLDYQLSPRFLSVLQVPSNSFTASLPVQPQLQQHRSYTSTTTTPKKRGTEDEKDRIIIPNQKELVIMTTGNKLPPLSEEEALKIIEEEELKLEKLEREKFVPNWKPGMRKRPLQMSYSLEEFQRELEPEKYPERWNKNLNKRCGALAIKIGMMPLFDNEGWGMRYPCTVLMLDHNYVIGHKTQEKHGYYSVVVGAGERKAKNIKKCILGQYKHLLSTPSSSICSATGMMVTEESTSSSSSSSSTDEDISAVLGITGPPLQHPPYLVREFRVTAPSLLIPLHSQIHASHFVPGQNLDISGISKGKGFQGGMKRHGFSGMPASHGVSRSHREIGSTGSCQDPGKVFKGKKMPGHMGVDRVTVQNLRLLQIDRGRNLLYVLGAIPGNRGEFVEVRDAIKKPLWNTDKVLDKVDRPPCPTYSYDLNIDGCGQPGYEVFMPRPERDPSLPDNEDEAA